MQARILSSLRTVFLPFRSTYYTQKKLDVQKLWELATAAFVSEYKPHGKPPSRLHSLGLGDQVKAHRENYL